MYNKFLGMRNFEKDAERLLTELGSAPDAFVQGFGKILTIHHDDGGVEVFDVISAGFTAALAAADAGDAVWLPPFASIGDAHTIPAGVGVQAYGKKSTLTGPITMGASSFLNSVYVVKSASDAGALTGVIGPAAGIAYLNDCSIIVTNSGAGNGIAVQDGGGEVQIWFSNLEGIANSGNAYAVNVTAGGVIKFKGFRLSGQSTSGSGYAGRCTDGDLYVRFAELDFSTDRFIRV